MDCRRSGTTDSGVQSPRYPSGGKSSAPPAWSSSNCYQRASPPRFGKRPTHIVVSCGVLLGNPGHARVCFSRGGADFVGEVEAIFFSDITQRLKVTRNAFLVTQGLPALNGSLPYCRGSARNGRIKDADERRRNPGLRGCLQFPTLRCKQSFNNFETTAPHPNLTCATPIFIRPKAAFVGESLLWRTAMWMRSCVICKALLKKLRLSDFVRCQCGAVRSAERRSNLRSAQIQETREGYFFWKSAFIGPLVRCHSFPRDAGPAIIYYYRARSNLRYCRSFFTK